MSIKKPALIILLLIATVFIPYRAARADLAITPIRIVFEGRDRSANISLLNVTDKTHTYRMRWLEMKMDSEGRYVMDVADEKNPYSVANMVIYTPRQVTIQPHAYQTVRLSLRRPADLPPGEYRAHLAFTRLAAAGPEQPDPDPPKGKSLSLNVNLSFSVPIIVRSGDDKDLKISLNSPQLAIGGTAEKPVPVLKLNLNRDSGKFSSYGSIKVFWQPNDGPEQQIGIQNNVALYPELQQRHLTVTLTANPTGGKLRVQYIGKYESEGKIWDEKIFPLG